MIKKYRKKPLIIEAIQWNGDNFNEVIYNFAGIISGLRLDNKLDIVTLEGIMTADIGDYIIRGIKGEFYPCKSDIFDNTYELIENINVKDSKLMEAQK